MPRKKKALTIEEQLRRVIGELIAAKRFTLAAKLLTIIKDDAMLQEEEKKSDYKEVGE